MPEGSDSWPAASNCIKSMPLARDVSIRFQSSMYAIGWQTFRWFCSPKPFAHNSRMTSKAILFLCDSLNLPTTQIWLIDEEPGRLTDSLNERTVPFLPIGFRGVVSHSRIFDFVRPSSGILLRKFFAKSSSRKEPMSFRLFSSQRSPCWFLEVF